jgi:predicted metal-dependent enzyme (double-stranded beta helix superfamily)
MTTTQDTVQAAIAQTMAEARRAIDADGVTDAAMRRIQQALRALATTPGLLEQAALAGLHGSGAGAAALASEGIDGLTLMLARFPPDAPTPVHDHGSWGVSCVVAGRDRYVHWERLDDGRDPDRAQVRVRYETVLGPGDSVCWSDPPGDIHSQQGEGEPAWELVLFGRDALQTTRHYFDPETGRVHTASPRPPGT